jgi:dTDP-4-dehydrorhamnose 3,5-epimerase
MKKTALKIEDAFFFDRIRPEDRRGFFTTVYQSDWHELGPEVQFNVSQSRKGVFRGLHYSQGTQPEAKFVSVLKGEILDFIFDVRPGSKTYGIIQAVKISSYPPRTIYIPPGCAHGFVALDDSLVAYAATKLWNPEDERGYNWQSDATGFFIKTNMEYEYIDPSKIIISDKDQVLPFF